MLSLTPHDGFSLGGISSDAKKNAHTTFSYGEADTGLHGMRSPPPVLWAHCIRLQFIHSSSLWGFTPSYKGQFKVWVPLKSPWQMRTWSGPTQDWRLCPYMVKADTAPGQPAPGQECPGGGVVDTVLRVVLALHRLLLHLMNHAAD